ncbi:MAG: glycosyltransferase family 2 protein [Gemmatimonadaceae bacterium]|nr:glycosyltransferase family 2 protein [Gemmatimonadaceae bacterium]
MLYVCIPTHNEAETIGLLLWRIRKVFQEYPREYEVLVYDDASSDSTREVLQPYERALPLTLIGGQERVGYARGVEALLREASKRTNYPRRDAVIVMQGDFSDRPEHIPDLVKRFEGGADVVVGEQTLPADAPEAERRLRRYLSWLPRVWMLRNAVTVPGASDPWSGYRLMRITVVRDVLRSMERSPVRAESTLQANLEMLRTTFPHARRIESVQVTPRFDLRPRASRRLEAWPQAWALAKAAWAVRKQPLEPRPAPPARTRPA